MRIPAKRMVGGLVLAGGAVVLRQGPGQTNWYVTR